MKQKILNHYKNNKQFVRNFIETELGRNTKMPKQAQNVILEVLVGVYESNLSRLIDGIECFSKGDMKNDANPALTQLFFITMENIICKAKLKDKDEEKVLADSIQDTALSIPLFLICHLIEALNSCDIEMQSEGGIKISRVQKKEQSSAGLEEIDKVIEIYKKTSKKGKEKINKELKTNNSKIISNKDSRHEFLKGTYDDYVNKATMKELEDLEKKIKTAKAKKKKMKHK